VKAKKGKVQIAASESEDYDDEDDEDDGKALFLNPLLLKAG